jgi:hypothetical protein
MPPAKFEPAIPASERTQTHALDREPTGIGLPWLSRTNNFWCVSRLKRFTPNRYVVSILVFSSLAQGHQYGVADYSSEIIHHWNESVWHLTRSGIMRIDTIVIIIIVFVLYRKSGVHAHKSTISLSLWNNAHCRHAGWTHSVNSEVLNHTHPRT